MVVIPGNTSILFNETTSLNAADVWIFCAVDANDVVKAECDQTIANNSIFNGDDVWAIQEIKHQYNFRYNWRNRRRPWQWL